METGPIPTILCGAKEVGLMMEAIFHRLGLEQDQLANGMLLSTT